MKKIVFVILIVALISTGFWIRSRRQSNAPDVPFIQVRRESSPRGATTTQNPVNEPGTSVVSSSEILLTVISPADKSTVTSPNIQIKGKTASKAEVFVNESETVADANGNFSVYVTLDEGENYFFVVSNDEYGNVAERELTVTYDNGA